MGSQTKGATKRLIIVFGEIKDRNYKEYESENNLGHNVRKCPFRQNFNYQRNKLMR